MKILIRYSLEFLNNHIKTPSQMFRMNSNMGPKIIMIQKMMIDLFFFIFLMIVFLIGYGVCAQVGRYSSYKHGTVALTTLL